ncbi:MAG: protein translocase subunit SecF [Chloroflexi bacterium]|nr:protein translocase subunit SecF [Chloroflexota bacterium]
MRVFDLVSSRKWFFLFSGVLVVASLVLLAIPPTFKPGIEFTAGTTTLVRFEGPVDQAELRAAYADLGHSEARLQSTGANEFLIRTSELRIPDSALIEVVPSGPPVGVGQPSAEVGTVLLGAEGAAGEIGLRVFQFGEVCDFGDEIASFPAGTEASVFAEIRGCDIAADDAEVGADDDATPEASADDAAATATAQATATPTPEATLTPEATATPTAEATTEDPAATATPAATTDETTETPADGDDGDEELVYRVQVGGASGVTGFIAAADTHDFRLPGEGEDEDEGAAASAATADDLGERGEIEEALAAQFGPFEVLEFASVSAVVSKQAVRNASVAVVVAALFIMGYVVFAFSSVPRPFRYAMAAMIALAHDVIIVLGAFSLFGKLFGTEINLMFVTGLLTIIGFSVHDTIVIFDRVRENVRLAPTARFAENVNAALLQTLGRSLNTSVTLLFTILALLWLGGTTIQSFLLVLLVGVVAGAYSSIAIAAQVLVSWDEGDVPRLLARFRRRSAAEEEATAG